MQLEPTVEAPGAIAGCETAGCGYTCCEFNQGNFIVMPPGEVEEARAEKSNLEHLELTPLPFGGWRAVCHAKETATCDGGYKPLDCRSYPFFPTVDDDGHLTASLKGAKCPLTVNRLGTHRSWVEKLWKGLVESSPSLHAWLAKVRLVGYELVPRGQSSDRDGEYATTTNRKDEETKRPR